MGPRLQNLLLVALALAAVVLVGLAIRTPQPEPPDTLTSPPVPISTASGGLRPTTPTQPPAPAIVPVRPLVATNGRSKPLVLFVGDSYVSGVGASQPKQTGFVPQLSAALGWEARASGAPGTGFMRAGTRGPLADLVRAADLATLQPDLVVLNGAHNDVTGPVDQLPGRVREVVELIDSLAPQAQVVIVGVLWPGPPPAAAKGFDVVLKAAANSAGANFSHTYDLRFTSSGPGNRPDDDGYRLIAERLRASFIDLGLAAG